MTRSQKPPAPSLHEWPLVVFTTAATIGSAFVVSGFGSLAIGVSAPDAAPLAARGALLLGAGLLVSLGHLGRPSRAPLALRQLGRSRLSAEIALAGTTLALAVATLAYPSLLALVAAGGAGLAFLVSLGLVYDLPGQPAWRGAVVWTPLSTGLAMAATVAAAIPSAPPPWLPAAAVLVLADLALFVMRVRRLTSLPAGCLPVHPELFRGRTLLFGQRIALANALPLLLLAAGRPHTAAAVLAVGILVDRVQFYALAAQQTSEGEVSRAEEVMGRLAP